MFYVNLQMYKSIKWHSDDIITVTTFERYCISMAIWKPIQHQNNSLLTFLLAESTNNHRWAGMWIVCRWYDFFRMTSYFLHENYTVYMLKVYVLWRRWYITPNHTRVSSVTGTFKIVGTHISSIMIIISICSMLLQRCWHLAALRHKSEMYKKNIDLHIFIYSWHGGFNYHSTDEIFPEATSYRVIIFF